MDAVWAFVSVDKNGMEGLCGVYLEGAWYPLITAKESVVRLMKPMAQGMLAMLPNDSEHQIKLVKFTNREELESYGRGD